jgi:RNA polymerase primary sigma factor
MRALKITSNIQDRTLVLEKYFNDINKISLEDEKEIIKRIKEGDKRALDKLVINNLRFVVSVAKQYTYFGVPLMDLINEGNLGLITAAHKFDYDCDLKFISYAVWHVRANIQNHLNSLGNIVRIPVNRTSSSIKLSRLVGQKEQELGYEISHGLAIDLFDDVKMIDIDHFYLKYGKRDSSLDFNMGDSDESFSLSDTLLLSDDTWVPDSLSEEDETKRILKWALSQLNYKEQTIMKYQLEFGSITSHVDVIAEELKITTYAVKVNYRNILNKLKNLIESYNPYNTSIKIPKKIKQQRILPPLKKEEIKLIVENDLKLEIEAKKKEEERKERLNRKLTRDEVLEIRNMDKKPSNVLPIKKENELSNNELIVLDAFFGGYIGEIKSDKVKIREISKNLGLSKGEILGIVNRYKRANR